MFAGIATIDGPPASGKTTMASLLAKEFGLTHLDSGSIFRTLTLFYMENGIDLNNESEVVSNLSLAKPRLEGERIFLGEEDVSKKIRHPEVTKNVCCISNIPIIRKYVKEVQLLASKSGKVVADGRKVGVEVFPNAKVKFYLTADQEVRAMRRFKQLQESNPEICFEEVYSDLKARETKEKNNGVLLIPENPIIIDNTNLSIQETFLVMKAHMV